jgi:aspartate/methionine/tyrosine aminotransferase
VAHRYSATAGLPELRGEIAEATARGTGWEVDAGQVVVTNGGKAAIYEVCQALLDPGDEVILPAPYWVTYPEAARLAGADVVEVFAGAEAGFQVSVDQLEAARTDRTKLLVFTSPSNPTGAVYDAERVAAIGRWAAEHGIWVMSDDIYEHLVYGDATFSSMPGLVPELRERSVIINGVSKTYAMTGWRVGWMVAPEPFAKAVARLQTHVSTNVANVSQQAARAALGGGLESVEGMRRVFDRRRRTMHRLLNEVPGVTCLEPEGAFYAFPSMVGLLDRPLGESGRAASTTLELAEVLLDEAGIAIVPGEAFGAPGYARLSFALGDDELQEGLERLRAAVGG